MPAKDTTTPRACEQCGSAFTDKSVGQRKRFCSKSCADKKRQMRRVPGVIISTRTPQGLQGRVVQLLLSPGMMEHRNKRVPVICITCRTPFWVGLSKAKQKQTCSDECHRRWVTERQRGAKSHLWRGGRAKAATLFRESADYASWRAAVFERDNYTCQMCLQRGGKLAAHHIKRFALHPDLALIVPNGITLCWPCHLSIKGKEHEHEEQFFALTGGV